MEAPVEAPKEGPETEDVEAVAVEPPKTGDVQNEVAGAAEEVQAETEDVEAPVEAPKEGPETEDVEAVAVEPPKTGDVQKAEDTGNASATREPEQLIESPEPKSTEPPAIRMVQKSAENVATSPKISAKGAPAIKPAAIKPAEMPQAMQEPKKIPAKKPVPKKAASKTATVKKAKKTSLIKSAKTPKKRKAAQVPNTLEDELAIQLTPQEIDSFQIEKVDMEKLTHKVCDILLRCESEGMLQADLYRKLKLSARNGARLSLKLERMGMVNRIKLLAEERWTYKLVLKKTPVSTTSLENAPCLICPVEQKCSVDGDISPRTCVLIEEWVIADMKRRS